MNSKFRMFMTTAEELLPFWQKIGIIEKAIGRVMTRPEREWVFMQMRIGKEVQLKDLGIGKKILIIGNENDHPTD